MKFQWPDTHAIFSGRDFANLIRDKQPMVRSVIVALVAFLASCFTYVKADVEPTLVYHGTVTTKNGSKVSGFFHCYSFYVQRMVTDTFFYTEGNSLMYLNLRQDSVSNLYRVNPFQYHISNHILRTFKSNDSLAVYPDAVIIGGVSLLLDKHINIKSSDVTEVDIHFVHFGSYGSASSPYSRDDKVWLSKTIFAEENIGVADMCDFSAYSFVLDSAGLKKELKTFYSIVESFNEGGHEDDHHRFARFWKAIRSESDRLKKLKIVVVYVCGC
jgi:hypothetical protein